MVIKNKPKSNNKEIKNNSNRHIWMIAIVAVVVLALGSLVSVPFLNENKSFAGQATYSKILDNDQDNILNAKDNCEINFNPDQKDTDGDGEGDACDTCPLIPKEEFFDDGDLDGVGDQCDNCWEEKLDKTKPDQEHLLKYTNPDQKDMDKDGIGDKCDEDIDGDGLKNIDDACPENIGSCDNDLDGDNIKDIKDSCINYYGDESELSKTSNRVIVNYTFNNETEIGINKAIYFNSSKYLLVMPFNSTNGNNFMNKFNDFTITFWMKTNYSGEQCVFSMPYHEDFKAKKGVSFCFDQNATLYTPFIYDNINFQLRDNKWHFITIVRNNTQIKITLDSQLNRYAKWCGTLKSEAFVLGAEGYYVNEGEYGKLKIKNNFIGSIDEFKVYNYALTSTQIKEIFKTETINLLGTYYLETKK